MVLRSWTRRGAWRGLGASFQLAEDGPRRVLSEGPHPASSTPTRAADGPQTVSYRLAHWLTTCVASLRAGPFDPLPPPFTLEASLQNLPLFLLYRPSLDGKNPIPLCRLSSSLPRLLRRRLLRPPTRSDARRVETPSPSSPFSYRPSPSPSHPPLLPSRPVTLLKTEISRIRLATSSASGSRVLLERLSGSLYVSLLPRPSSIARVRVLTQTFGHPSSRSRHTSPTLRQSTTGRRFSSLKKAGRAPSPNEAQSDATPTQHRRTFLPTSRRTRPSRRTSRAKTARTGRTAVAGRSVWMRRR